MWTQFWDMHSGGGQKEKFSMCYIEAPQQEAEVIFYNRFGHSPDRVSCTCCGADYSVSEEEELSQITAKARYVEQGRKRYDSGFHTLIPLQDYLAQKDVCVIYAKDILPEEREGTVPQEGYV